MAFVEEAMRLLRETWGPNKHVQELAEEIYCILSQWDNQGLNGQVLVNSRGETPFKAKQEEEEELPPFLFEFEFSDGGKTQMTFDGTVQFTAPTMPGQPAPDPVKAGKGGNGLLGRIVSGSGSSYQVSIDGIGTVSATHPQINEDETIPVGRYVSVFKSQSNRSTATGLPGTTVTTTYTILEPTWL